MLKNLNIILICLLFTYTVHADMMDSGKPVERIYKVEEVSQYLGKRVLVQFIDENLSNSIVLNVKGILVSRWDNEDFLLLGRTEYKNRVVIPIEKINHIEIISGAYND